MIDAEKRELTLAISAKEMKARRKSWKPVKPRYTRGVLAKYASAVTSASLGAVTDSNLEAVNPGLHRPPVSQHT